MKEVLRVYKRAIVSARDALLRAQCFALIILAYSSGEGRKGWEIDPATGNVVRPHSVPREKVN